MKTVTRKGPNRLSQPGFSLVELLTVLGVVATLVLIAVPVYVSARSTAQKRTCFQNQNTLYRATELYLAVSPSYKRSDLAGLVTETHPIVVEHIVGAPPRCPSGITPLDPATPTIAEGAYRFDAAGELVGCTLGLLGPHGSFRD